MAQQKNVHYFPGHMSKALRDIASYTKAIDLVVEVRDARAPLSSANPYLDEILQGKARLYLLSKSDMADPSVTSAWISYFASKGIRSIAGNLKKDRLLSLLSSASSELLSAKRAKEKKIGMKPQPVRVMIAGIPNVGKSTLINNLGGRKIAITGNKAGVTRCEQWIKLSEDFVVLDTPGILPMNYEDHDQAVRLALLGSMKEEVLPTEDLAYALLDYLRAHYPSALSSRFAIDSIASSDDVILALAAKRGLLENGAPSLSKGSYLLLKEFKDGILGRFSLETPPHA